MSPTPEPGCRGGLSTSGRFPSLFRAFPLRRFHGDFDDYPSNDTEDTHDDHEPKQREPHAG